MKSKRMIRRLGLGVALLGLLVMAAAAPAAPAAPNAGTISTGSGVQVWNGHNCSAVVPVNIAGLSAGLGGYETKLSWPAGRFSSADGDIAIDIGTYLKNGDTRSQAGEDGTPPLKAASTDAVKFGAYSWGAGAGNVSDGQLATVAIKPSATCGTAALTLSETQLVDISGNEITLTAQNGSSVNVLGRYNINGDGVPVVLANDVIAVVNQLTQPTSTNCGAGYQYNVNGDGVPVVLANDVIAVVNKLTHSACQ